jgi:hypothetical protein
MIMFVGIFVDDDERDFKYAEVMSIYEEPSLNVTILRPDKPLVDLADEILSSRPDLLALDFRLDEVLFEDKPNRYKAGPLAQQLRDHATEVPSEDFPIILVSHEQKVRDFYNPDLTTHDLFDRIYKKESIGGHVFKNEILSLIVGYRKIIDFIGKDDALAGILSLNKEYKDAIPSQFFIDIAELKAPHQISRYILKNVIFRTGVLLDTNEILAKFGISPTSNDIPEFKNILFENQVNYKGIFSEGWERWWAFKLEEFGQSLCGDVLGKFTAEQRCACINGEKGINLTPAVSRWTNRTSAYFAVACTSCHSPTEFDFSVEAHDPVLYDFLEKKRICWKCVQTGQYKEKGLRVSESDKFIAGKIENGQILPEG